MKKQVISLFLAFGISLVAGAQPQEKRRAITLEEAITIARVQSVDAAVALNELKTAYWEYRTFRADLLPEMNFEATIPSYNKKYNSYQQDNGAYTFVRNNYMDTSVKYMVKKRYSIWRILFKLLTLKFKDVGEAFKDMSEQKNQFKKTKDNEDVL